MRKVISTKARKKRKKAPQVSACPECGDFHYRKSDICKVRELKVKMIVQQIMNQSVNIKVSKFVNFTDLVKYGRNDQTLGGTIV